ncbi:MAG: hypothetical protein K9N06_02390 [Candidatus Cloacimonetes bacterium]|nr:hypothetical protein [Candidatus Cloacimonadota bacterium]
MKVLVPAVEHLGKSVLITGDARDIHCYGLCEPLCTFLCGCPPISG